MLEGNQSAFLSHSQQSAHFATVLLLAICLLAHLLQDKNLEEDAKEHCVWCVFMFVWKPEGGYMQRLVRYTSQMAPEGRIWFLTNTHTYTYTFDLLPWDRFHRLRGQYTNLPLQVLNRQSSVSGRWRPCHSTHNQTQGYWKLFRRLGRRTTCQLSCMVFEILEVADVSLVERKDFL